MILALFQFSLAPFVRHNIQSWEQDYSLGPCSLRAFTFNLRGRSFIFRSRRNASGFSIGPLMHTSLTGRRQHVYRLALPDLCASSLRLMSLVTPQYRVLSAQRRRYVNHGFSPCWLNFRPHFGCHLHPFGIVNEIRFFYVYLANKATIFWCKPELLRPK